jgi:heme exporter protein B
MSFLRHAWAVAWKDLRVELRTREILYTMVFFAAMVVVVCSFAFVNRGPASGELAGGVLWIAVAFAGTLGVGRAFDREREGQTLRGLLLSPSERGAVFLGKAVGVTVYMLLCEVVVVPLLGILFAAPVGRHLGHLCLILTFATLGFAVVGSAFAGMLLRSRAREVLLAVTLFPVVTPALIAGSEGTGALWTTPAALPQAWFWIRFLAVFDAIFLAVSLWAFESLVIE